MSLVARIVQNLQPALIEEMVTPPGRSLTATEKMDIDRNREVVTRRIAEQIVATVRNALDERLIEEMCRGHDAEDAAQKGEPSPWRPDLGAYQDHEWRAERRAAMLCALQAVGLA